MHFRIFTLTCLLTSALRVDAQGSIPWPMSDAEWKVQHTEAHGLLIWVTPNQLQIINGQLHTEITYTLGADTLLSGQLYTSLIRSWDSFFESAPSAVIDTTVDYPPQAGGFRGGFRAQGDQVHFWDVTDQSEHLLYDFDLLVSDTLPPSFVHQNANASVALIDTLVIGGQMHRRFLLQGVGIYGSVIIEGIGSNHGPIEPIGLGFDINDALVCYGRNGMTLYPDTGDACGPQWGSDVGMEERNVRPTALAFPNPFGTSTTIQFDPHEGAVIRWSIRDGLGRLVDEKSLVTSHASSFTFDAQDLSEGIYLLHWLTDTGTTGILRLVKVG